MLIRDFNPLTLADDLAPLGLRLHEDLSPWDIQMRYFMECADHYHAYEHAHFAHLVVEWNDWLLVKKRKTV